VANLTPLTVAVQAGVGIVSSAGVSVDDLSGPDFVQINSTRKSSVTHSTVRTIAMEECCNGINISDNTVTNTWYGLQGTDWVFGSPYVNVQSIYSTDMSCRNITVHQNICSGGAYMAFIGVNLTITDNTVSPFPYFSNGFKPNLIELEIVDGCQVSGNTCEAIGYNTTANHPEIIPYLQNATDIHNNFTAS